MANDWVIKTAYLHYNNFNVGNASEEYPLTIGGFTGEVPNRFSSDPLNGRKFSSLYNDNNCSSGHNCTAV